MRKLRPFRKDSIFRLYLALFALSTAFAMIVVVRAQGSANRRIVESLERRIAELESRPVVAPVEPSSAEFESVSVPENPVVASARREDEKLFWVEGHGFNGRYAYLDLEFRDGYRARYYFRPYPDRVELARLHRRIEHDALRHYFPLDIIDDS